MLLLRSAIPPSSARALRGSAVSPAQSLGMLAGFPQSRCWCVQPSGVWGGKASRSEARLAAVGYGKHRVWDRERLVSSLREKITQGLSPECSDRFGGEKLAKIYGVSFSVLR